MKLLLRIFSVLLLLGLTGAGAFHVRIVHLVNLPMPTTGQSAQANIADQYYFAYGSNMPTRYLYNVRGVLPAHSEAGVVENYEVSFMAPGLNSLEPAFTFLTKSESKKAYGVLHHVSKQDLVKVKESEGALYEWATLPVELKNGEVVAAQTLVRLSHGDVGVPSKRYLQILIEGAREHGLPEVYVKGLLDMPSVYVPLASELMGDVVFAFVMKNSGKCTSVFSC